MGRKEIDFFDKWNRDYRSGEIDANSVTGRLGQAVLGEVSLLPLARRRIVEIGCGTGWLAGELIKLGAYLGLDLSPEAIRIALNRVPDARFVASDLFAWDFKGEQFNVGLLVDSISTFMDQNGCIAKIASILEDKGYFILTSVNPFVYSRMSWVKPPVEGQIRNWLKRPVLRDLLQCHSFEILKFHTILPAGDKGLLRYTNAPKLNRMLGRVFPTSWLVKAKELAGLGQYFIVVSRLNR
ncbi:MAG: class I SAM-dependent methyltransferase [Verrucomicrobia bacterium]|nr:class I SAM-dependent methyltransferase [Verrucomicrobiota bacterium]